VVLHGVPPPLGSAVFVIAAGRLCDCCPRPCSVGAGRLAPVDPPGWPVPPALIVDGRSSPAIGATGPAERHRP